MLHKFFLTALIAVISFSVVPANSRAASESEPDRKSLTGTAAVAADWTQDAPGVRHKFTVSDLPPPYQTESVTNHPRVVTKPKDAQPQVPAGFKTEEDARGFDDPRCIPTAPNGDT